VSSTAEACNCNSEAAFNENLMVPAFQTSLVQAGARQFISSGTKKNKATAAKTTTLF